MCLLLIEQMKGFDDRLVNNRRSRLVWKLSAIIPGPLKYSNTHRVALQLMRVAEECTKANQITVKANFH